MNDLGAHLVALAAPLTWAWSIAGFQPALARQGAFDCNLFKSTVGSLLFWVTLLVWTLFATTRAPGVGATILLLLSGCAGMAVGDYAFMRAMVSIGPRPAAVIQATSPIFLLIFSLFDPRESLTPMELLGVLLVIAGTLEVTRRRRGGAARTGARDSFAAGAAWALIAALGQAVGIILARGPLEECDVLWAATIRLTGSALALALPLVLLGRTRRLGDAFTPGFARLTIEPTLTGTYLGIGLMMAAVAWGKTAVTGALLSTTPIFLVPIATWRLGIPFDVRILLGTATAVAGIIVLGVA